MFWVQDTLFTNQSLKASEECGGGEGEEEIKIEKGRGRGRLLVIS